MITKELFAQSMARDCDIAVHLFSKLPADSYDYRPSPGQRSTVELLRYLAICGIGGITAMMGGDFKLFAPLSERVKDMTVEEFPAAMAQQKQEILDFFESVSEETLLTQLAPVPGGQQLPLGAALLVGPAKWLAAYKMQLFLYAKACGASELKTANLWRGSDPAPPKPA
jgi:hypothetical protein